MISSLVLEAGRNGGGKGGRKAGKKKGWKLLKNPSLAKLKTLAKNRKNVVWIDVKDADERDYRFLRETFGFHPLTIDDCRQDLELPKTEQFGSYLFVVFHKVDYDPRRREIEMAEMDTVLGRNYLVTVHKGERPSVDSLEKQITTNPSIMLRGADFLLHSLIDYTTDQYLPLLDSWDMEIENLEDEIIQGKTEGAIEKLVDFRRRVSEMRRSMSPQSHVLSILSRRDLPFVSPKVSVYFRDIYDHVSKASGILESQRDLINSAFQAYSSTSSNQMNEIMKTLTLVATIMLPLTLIAGIYGMNFQHMPELRLVYAYPLILLVMLVIGIGMLAYFRKKGWM